LPVSFAGVPDLLFEPGDAREMRMPDERVYVSELAQTSIMVALRYLVA